MSVSIPWTSLGPFLGFTLFFLFTFFYFLFVVSPKREKTPEIEDRPASKLLNRWFREYWFWLTDPAVKFFVAIKLTPNSLTSIGILLSFFSAYLFYIGDFGWAGWLMIFAGTFDTFDGRVARAINRETKSGAFYDSIADRVAEGAVFVCIATYYFGHIGYWISFIALIGTVLVSYSRAKGEANGVKYDGGMMQRPERVVYIGVGGVFTPIFSWGILSFFQLDYSFEELNKLLYLLPLSFVALFTWTTSFNRIFYIMKELDKKQFG
jgi:phosphatidylglycerophosphate synthase